MLTGWIQVAALTGIVCGVPLAIGWWLNKPKPEE